MSISFTVGNVPHTLCKRCIDWPYVTGVGAVIITKRSSKPCEACGKK